MWLEEDAFALLKEILFIGKMFVLPHHARVRGTVFDKVLRIL